ncbi:MAG: precorrin-4 C(11)-methyltransferase [Candidatus Verstraetearchaeota archaeon]|nr:precorrin-4 C(11)-methyltransferase [Candidatus Verstraetearchaeota archaeon]
MSKVVIIGAGPGDPELITIKGKKWLERADVVIYAGSLLNPEILKYAKPGAQLYDSASMDREEIFRLTAESARAGKLVARVHDGDPSFYGAIQEQVDLLEREGIECIRVPGVSCLQAGAAALNRELTLPNVSQTVIITRPEGRTPVPKPERLRSLAAHQATMVIFLGIQHLRSVVEELEKGGYPKTTPVAVVYKASWPEEKVIRGTLEDILGKVEEAGITKTALIFVGKVLDTSAYDYSKLYDPSFTHGFRKGERDVP